MILALVAVSMTAMPAGAFEIITADDITHNIITRDMLIATADNFIILYDASGSMADEYKAGVAKLDAELDILKQQNKILPMLAYNAGLYCFTPFKAYYDVAPYDRQKFGAAIDQLPNTRTAGGFAGQPTPWPRAWPLSIPSWPSSMARRWCSSSPTAPTPTTR